MRSVISAGGMFVKKEKGKYYLLLSKYPKYGDYGFLKGHVESGETIEKAALREVFEEAGLANVVIVKKLGSVTRNSKEKTGETVCKTIHLFLMATEEFNHLPSEEKYEWVEYDTAINKMAFKEEAEFLRLHKGTVIKSASKGEAF